MIWIPFIKQVENLIGNLPAPPCAGNKSNEKSMIKNGFFVTTTGICHNNKTPAHPIRINPA
jgi:hypothetical protein